MTVEVNIIFRENPSALVIPNEALLAGAVQVVQNGEVRRVTVSTGVRGSRTTEILGPISPGTMLVVPARKELHDGARVSVENESTAAGSPAGSPTVATKPPQYESPSIQSGPEQSVDQAISAALSAHIGSIVNDARRDAARRP